MARRPAPPPPPQLPSSASTDSDGSSSVDKEHEQARYLFQKKPSAAPSETAKSSAAASAAADYSTSDGEDDNDDEEGSEEYNEEEEKEKLKEKPNEQEDEEGSSEEDEDEEEEEEDEEEEDAEEETNNSQSPERLQKDPPPPESEANTCSFESDDEAPLPATLATPSPFSIKPISSGPMDSPTSKPFQRFWSIQDELAILRGMAEYRDKHGIIPTVSHDMPGFLDFIKDSLGVEVTKTRLGDKVRRLKNKFIATVARKNGAAPTFSNPHDKEVYQLSKKIWGPGNTALAVKLNGGEAELTADDASEQAKKHLMFPYLSEYILKMDNGAPYGFGVKRSFELMDSGKAAVLDMKVKKLKLKGMRMRLKEMDLVKDSVKLVVDSLATLE